MISDAFEFCEPEFYKLVKTVTRDDDSKNNYNVLVGRCNQQTSVEYYKYDEKRKNTLIVTGESISKKEPNKITGKKMHLKIVPGALTLFYQQGNHN